FVVPGDISSAAFWLVAASAFPGSQLTVKNVGLNPTRNGILKILVRMGAYVSESVGTNSGGEETGNVSIQGGKLKGIEIGGDIVPNIIDEIPIIAVAAALADGKTIIKDAAELRVKESDRISAVAENLRKMGADLQETSDGMVINGGHELQGAELESFGDHRIAMAFAVAGLFASGQTIITDAGCVAISYPNFEEHLIKLASENRRFSDRSIPVITSFPESNSKE
ncbi:3-phosphoshikimate 1-carboxyvinyltransferase, partial [Verrucomicrobiales bacterium]|nr:3-phosphoshikimate 1-carboxyvinyltransferase [Verrucomicrobiales bacterium]